MRQNPRQDLGNVQVHKKVLSEIINTAMEEVQGVRLYKKGIGIKIMQLMGKEVFPGVEIKVNDNDEVTLNIKVIIQYGRNIPNSASQIQDAVKSAIERTVDINLKNINVNIQGIERGKNEFY